MVPVAVEAKVTVSVAAEAAEAVVSASRAELLHERDNGGVGESGGSEGGEKERGA